MHSVDMIYNFLINEDKRPVYLSPEIQLIFTINSFL